MPNTRRVHPVPKEDARGYGRQTRPVTSGWTPLCDCKDISLVPHLLSLFAQNSLVSLYVDAPCVFEVDPPDEEDEDGVVTICYAAFANEIDMMPFGGSDAFLGYTV